MSSSKLRSKEREWKPKMKQRGRKATVSDSGSSQAAQLAMANLKDIGRRRDRGQDIDEAYLAKVSQTIDPTAALKQQMAAARSHRGTPRWAVAAGLAGIACLLVAGIAAGFHGNRHSVAGVVLLGKSPLAGVELQFHETESGRTAGRVKTSKKGAFDKTWLPPGSYKVTVHTDDGSKADIPESYRKPESTQLQVNLDKDLEHIWMKLSQQ